MIAVYDFKPTYINFIILISVSPSFSFQSSINNERGAPLKRNRLFHSNYQYTEIGLAKITYSWWVCVRVSTINRYVYFLVFNVLFIVLKKMFLLLPSKQVPLK